MKIRLFLAALCLFLAPLCFASSSQFSAYASGYVIAFGELIPCECEGPDARSDCICDGGSNAVNPESNTSSSLGSESLIILAALMLWLRFRAN